MLMTDPEKSRLEALAQQGFEALRRGDAATARRAFEAITASGRATPPIWLLLAQACDLADDRPATRSALDAALAGDPDNPQALVMHGELHSRDGDDRAATAWYDRAIAAAARRPGLAAELVARLQRADAERTAAAGRFRAALDTALARAGIDSAAAGARFAEALAILSGSAAPQLQQPTSFYFPQLPQIAFYDPGDFAWVPALEAATAAIRAEALAMLADPQALQPYAEAARDRPPRVNDLLGNPRWSACHLIKNGEVTAEGRRCPATLAALAGLPMPKVQGRSPGVLFSILAPGMHIPPHHGMLNTRLICHLPLVVPPDCRLRVGNHIRDVREGRMLIFDDTIEHEAWNDSDAVRAVLLFDIWRPELTASERRAMTTVYESVAGYGEE